MILDVLFITNTGIRHFESQLSSSWQVKESLRNHGGNGNCNAMLLLFQNFVFRSNLLPLGDAEVVIFNSTTWKFHFWRIVLQI